MYFLLLYILYSYNTPAFTVTSPAFKNNELIPMKYTCEGDNVSIPLSLRELPLETKSLAIIMDDPDASQDAFDHWLGWNIPFTGKIEENSMPGVQGRNGKLENGYTGPCPPAGTHHYYIKVYALDTLLELEEGSDKKALEYAMQGHILATSTLIGLYKKAK